MQHVAALARLSNRVHACQATNFVCTMYHDLTLSELYEPMIASLRPERLRILAVQTVLRTPPTLVVPVQYTPVYLLMVEVTI